MLFLTLEHSTPMSSSTVPGLTRNYIYLCCYSPPKWKIISHYFKNNRAYNNKLIFRTNNCKKSTDDDDDDDDDDDYYYYYYLNTTYEVHYNLT